jgi:hypothetical protein
VPLHGHAGKGCYAHETVPRAPPAPRDRLVIIGGILGTRPAIFTAFWHGADAPTLPGVGAEQPHVQGQIRQPAQRCFGIKSFWTLNNNRSRGDRSVGRRQGAVLWPRVGRCMGAFRPCDSAARPRGARRPTGRHCGYTGDTPTDFLLHGGHFWGSCPQKGVHTSVGARSKSARVPTDFI